VVSLLGMDMQVKRGPSRRMEGMEDESESESESEMEWID
jgi:hypothetical protein